MSIADNPSRSTVTVPTIPGKLTKLSQWVCWNWQLREGTWAKVPVQTSGRNASTKDNATWGTFEDCYAAYLRNENFAGVGFVFSEDDPFFGIDLDSCIFPDGSLTKWAQKIVDTMGTYTEVSPSGVGLKLTGIGNLPLLPGKTGKAYRTDLTQANPDKAPEIAVYGVRRFWTFTGEVWQDKNEIRPCDGAGLWNRLFGNPPAKKQAPPPVLLPTFGSTDSRIGKALAAMLRIGITDHNDGSRRLYTAACRAVEHDLSDGDALDAIRQYERDRPFLRSWSDDEIIARVRQADDSPAVLRGEAVIDPVADFAGFAGSDATPQDSYPLTTIGSKSLQTLVGKLQRGEGDILYDAGEVFADFECGPGLLTFLAAGPGSGKTALAMQYGFQVLQHHPEIRLTVANAETGFDRLLKRELTRLSGVPARALRFADLTPAQLDAVEQAAAELEPLLTRVDVFEPPYTLKRIEQLQAVTPGLLILDYLQKFSPPNLDARNGATAVAAELRNLCHKGWAVLALSATARTTGKGGSNHDSQRLTLASLKESGEIEFNADAVYLIRDEGETDRPHVHDVELDCVKNRNGSMGGRRLVFDKPNLEFSLPAGSSLAAGEFAEWSGDDSDPFGGGQ